MKNYGLTLQIYTTYVKFIISISPQLDISNLKVKEMFPFELSLFDIASIVMIIMILAFYTIFLVKLKLPKEKEPISYVKREKNDIKPKKSDTPTAPTKTEEVTIEKAAPVVEKQEVHEENAKKIDDEAQAEKEGEHEKEKDAKKAFFLFGKKEFAGCVHKFGYLKTVPRNTPIPDECFGCPKILECLMHSKNK